MSEVCCCVGAPLRRVTVSSLLSIVTSKLTPIFSLLDLCAVFLSGMEKSAFLSISRFVFCMSASLSNSMVSSLSSTTDICSSPQTTENVSRGFGLACWWMSNNPLDALLSSAPRLTTPDTDFREGLTGDGGGDGSGFPRPLLSLYTLWVTGSLPARWCDTTDWGPCTCFLSRSSSSCRWISILMLLMVARDTRLALRASGEEGLCGRGVWTGVDSIMPFQTICGWDFSSFWGGQEKKQKSQ